MFWERSAYENQCVTQRGEGEGSSSSDHVHTCKKGTTFDRMNHFSCLISLPTDRCVSQGRLQGLVLSQTLKTHEHCNSSQSSFLNVLSPARATPTRKKRSNGCAFLASMVVHMNGWSRECSVNKQRRSCQERDPGHQDTAITVVPC